jgi:hypothetical protein
MIHSNLIRFLVVSTLSFVLHVQHAQAQQPRIFYSDIVSGPSSGGASGGGAFITIMGSGFGDAQGASTATLAGSPIQRIVQWSAHKIVVQIDSSSRSGPIEFEVVGKGRSNAIPFEVAAGHVYFVSTVGRDRKSGAFLSPWASIAHAAQVMRPGDITYVMDGVKLAGLDNYHAALSIQSAGTTHSPIALVAYPEARAVIGDSTGQEFGVRTPAIHSGPFSGWVLAGFTIRGANTALKLDGVNDWRVVNNDFSCPFGDGASGCVEVTGSSSIAFLGNTVHDTGKPRGSKRYQSVYFTTDSNHIDAGWNHIMNNRSCRGIQFHSSPVDASSGFNQYDLLIHDNQIEGQVCDGLNLATIDPSRGRIMVFNNLIRHVGTGPAPPDGESNYACISSPGIVNHGPAGSGTVEIFNNTLSDCGKHRGPSAGAFSVGIHSPELMLKNNLIDQAEGEAYFTSGTAMDHVNGSNNLWFGGGPAPQQTDHNLTKNPDLSQDENGFALSASSPAKHAGYDCGVAYDLRGASRAVIGKCSVGAFE